MLSIIIPTYNGKHKLPNILSSIEAQVGHHIEVLVVIDGSTDGTNDFLNHYSIEKPWLTIVSQSNQGRSIVRNNGAKLAKYDTLLFLDDDMVLDKDVVKAHVNFHQTHHDAILLGAIYEPDTILDSDFMKYRRFLSNKWGSQIQVDESKIIQIDYFSAGHFSIDKKIFLELGGFNEKLKDLEDYDFKQTCQQEHIPIYYHADLIAWHNDKVTCEKYTTRLKEYNNAFQKLVALYPEKYSSKKEERKLSLLKRAFYRLFHNKIHFFFIDRELVQWLPRKIRYRYYDFVVTAYSLF